jgi:uncharacterized protein YkwD
MSAPASRHRERPPVQAKRWALRFAPALAPAAVLGLSVVAWFGADQFGSVRPDPASSAGQQAAEVAGLTVPSRPSASRSGQSADKEARTGTGNLSRSQTRMTAQQRRQPVRPEPRPAADPSPDSPDAGGGSSSDRPPSGDGSGTQTPAQPSGDRGLESQVVTLVNRERAQAGCGPVRSEPRLALAARRHSQDMADNNYFEHASQDGRDFTARTKAAGYRGFAAAENIAAGSSTAAGVMDQWMTSEGHRNNILNCDLTELGVGVGKGGDYGTYWTQDFGQ